MPTIYIDTEEASRASVDRDSTKNDYGREGFVIYLPGVCIKFEDERDAELIAKKILYRLGY